MNFFSVLHDSFVTVFTPSRSPPLHWASSMPCSNSCAAVFVCVCVLIIAKSSRSDTTITVASQLLELNHTCELSLSLTHSLTHSLLLCDCCVPLCFLFFVVCFCDSLTCSVLAVALVITKIVCCWLVDFLFCFSLSWEVVAVTPRSLKSLAWVESLLLSIQSL